MSSCIIVLGTHRSGTSCTAGVLDAMGIDMGRNGYHAPDKRNKKGFFEDERLVLAHQSFIYQSGLDFDTFPIRKVAAMSRRERIDEYVGQRIDEGGDIWGVKDPRLCHLLPLLCNSLDHAEVDHKVIVVNRPTSEIANSLRKAGNTMSLSGEAAEILQRKKRSARKWYIDEYGDSSVLDIQFHDLLDDTARVAAQMLWFSTGEELTRGLLDDVMAFVDPDMAISRQR